MQTKRTRYRRETGQSAMEYLMTYGWAILIIAIVLVAFFSLNLFNPYTFAPKASPGSCQILRPNGPGSNIFVSAVGPTCTTNEIPEYVAEFGGASTNLTTGVTSFPVISPSSGAVTVTQWVYVSSYTPAAGFFTIHSSSTNVSFTAFIDEGGCVANTQYFLPMLKNGTHDTDVCVPPQHFPINTWVFVVSIVNNTNIVGYVGTGGILTNSSGSYLQSILTPTSFRIGYSYNGYFPTGSMVSNVQVYNTTLSSSQVSALYAEGIGGRACRHPKPRRLVAA